MKNPMKSYFFRASVLALLPFTATHMGPNALGGQRAAQKPDAKVLEVHSNYSIEFPAKQVVGPPGKLEFHAVARLYNKKRDLPLLWNVQVVSSNLQPDGSVKREVVWEQDYEDQPIPLKRGVPIQPALNEALAMPPGKYTVIVNIKQVRHTIINGNDATEYMPLVGNSFRAVVR